MAPDVPDSPRAATKPVMRVLVVDDEANHRFTVERALRKAGIESAAATSVRHAMERLRNEAFDVVITDVRVAGGDATSLLQWIGGYSPSTHLFVVSAQASADLREAYEKTANFRFLDKPIDTDMLLGLLEEVGPRRGFYGNSIEVEFFDYVQMIALSGRDKLVEVQTSGGNGLIWFEHGDIVHCEYGQFRGEMAFYKLLAVNRGMFRELVMRPPPLHTVTRSSTHLLMEAARQFDEGILGEVGPGGTKAELVRTDDPFVEVPTPPFAAAIDAVVPPSLGRAPLVDEDVEFESSFEDLNDLVEAVAEQAAEGLGSAARPRDNVTPITAARRPEPPERPEIDEPTNQFPRPELPEALLAQARATPTGPIPSPFANLVEAEASGPAAEDSAAMSTAAGHAIFDDPDTRSGMLDQFWQFEGINGVAIISSTGKVLAEDMRTNSSLVTLAGFYMRGAARIARTLGYNVFDGVVARSINGQQMVMVSMGAASAVLSVQPGVDPESVRDQVMGVE